MADTQTRHGRGLLVVAALAVIFFGLLGMILVRKGSPGASEPMATEELLVLPIRIRIRTEPNAKAPVVTTARNGEHVTLLEDRGAWVRVQTADGLSGWAERANLERAAEQARRAQRWAAIRKLPPLKGAATDRVQLYAGPGIFYPLVGILSEGTEVTVFTRDHDFYAVAQGKGIAYADVDKVDISAPSSRQVDVGSSSEPPVTDTTAAEPAVADTTAAQPVPAFEEPPSTIPTPAEPSSGVYSAVPPGGSQPQEIDRVIPRYPSSARRANIQGSVVVRGIVRRDGTIDNVEIIQDLPHGLGEEARRAVSRWRFRPATYRGEPIDVYYTVTVNFRLR